MPSTPHALPNDIGTLKRLLIGRDETIAKLVAEIARLKRWRFGRSAERMDTALMQLQLARSDLQVPAADEVCYPASVPVGIDAGSGEEPREANAARAVRLPRTPPARDDPACAGEL